VVGPRALVTLTSGCAIKVRLLGDRLVGARPAIVLALRAYSRVRCVTMTLTNCRRIPVSPAVTVTGPCALAAANRTTITGQRSVHWIRDSRAPMVCVVPTSRR
jgi:hypothetical protein